MIYFIQVEFLLLKYLFYAKKYEVREGPVVNFDILWSLVK